MRDPDALISTDTLAARLGESGLRIYDCTTYLEPPAAGSDDPYSVVSGRQTFLTGHVPGADFLDLQGELSATDTRLKFTMPSPAHLAGAFGGHGLGDDSRVVLYSLGSMMWSTRVWWMLRALGFDRAAVLDGGFDRWQAEGRPVERGEARGYPPASFTPRPRPGRFVDKIAVRAAIDDARTVTVNALGPQFHRGLEPSRYGRPGRVPGSVNVPAASLIDPATKRFVAPAGRTVDVGGHARAVAHRDHHVLGEVDVVLGGGGTGDGVEALHRGRVGLSRSRSGGSGPGPTLPSSRHRA